MKATMMAAVVVGLTIPATAMADDNKTLVHDPNGQVETDVSGYSGNVKDPAVHLEGYGLTGFLFSEVADKPCWFGTYFRMLSTPTADNVEGSRWASKYCERDGSPRNASTKKVFLGANYYVSGISVCTTDARDTRKRRLKGIKVFGSKIQTDPIRAVRTTESATAQRTNCKVWHERKNCPPKMVAYGYRAHMGVNGVTGISLMCTKLKEKGMITRPD